MKTLIGKTFTPAKRMAWYLLLSANLLIVSCHSNKPVASAPQTEQPAQSALAEQLMMSTLWYQKSLEAHQLYLQGYEFARIKTERNIENVGDERPLALIIDIDETVLDNSPYEASLIVNNESYSPESWSSWVQRAEAKPLPGALDFLRFAESRGIEIFYISNRSIENMEATLENLRRYDFPFADEEHLRLKEDDSDKTERRQRVMDEYSVILMVGDQLTDFSEDFKNQDVHRAFEIKELELAGEREYTLKEHFILLPNPMYGSFESAIYPAKGLTDEQKRDLRLRALETVE